jgi:hypothetical protein
VIICLTSNEDKEINDDMNEFDKQAVLNEFRTIPGVGISISKDLFNLGFRSIEELRDLDPEEMYRNICFYQCMHVDRCMLYVFRCAVYYASNETHDPELLKWWNWKDNSLSNHSGGISK